MLSEAWGFDYRAMRADYRAAVVADREDTEGNGPLRYGFLAQDVLALEGDAPVIIDNEDPDKLKITDQNLIAVLVNAIQELQARLVALEAK